MGNMLTIFPSYAPEYVNFPQYSFGGESFLMYFFIILTAFALATVSMMDSNSSSSFSNITNMVPKIGGNKPNNKKKY